MTEQQDHKIDEHGFLKTYFVELDKNQRYISYDDYHVPGTDIVMTIDDMRGKTEVEATGWQDPSVAHFYQLMLVTKFSIFTVTKLQSPQGPFKDSLLIGMPTLEGGIYGIWGDITDMEHLFIDNFDLTLVKDQKFVGAPGDPNITWKEAYMIYAIVKGMKPKHIMALLSITKSTYDTHISNIKRKTGMMSKHRMMNYFLETKLIARIFQKKAWEI